MTYSLLRALLLATLVASPAFAADEAKPAAPATESKTHLLIVPNEEAPAPTATETAPVTETRPTADVKVEDPKAPEEKPAETLAEIKAEPKAEETLATEATPDLPPPNLPPPLPPRPVVDAPWAEYTKHAADESAKPAVAPEPAPKKKKKAATAKKKTVKAKPQTAKAVARPNFEEQFTTPASAPAPQANYLVAPAAEKEKIDPYMPAGMLSPELLAAPPAEGTLAHRKQMDRVIAAQANIPADDMTAIVDEADMEVHHITSAIAGFDLNTHPATRHLLERVMATSKNSVGAAKKFWKTRRPFVVSDKVNSLVGDISHSPAYPSGHTAAARLLAEVTGLLMPQHREALRIKADAVAWHRVQAGVHYPIDLEGGRFFAGVMLGSLLTNADFVRDLNAASAELSFTPSQVIAK